MNYKRYIDQANEFDSGNILWRHNYFWCGHSSKSFYNYNFMIAMEIIGKTYNAVGSNSDYHNGIAYIAKQAKVTKTQVKAIRKKLKILQHYEFKTSTKFDVILAEIIKALKDCKASKKAFLSPETLYRDTLVYDQYSAIRVATRETQNKAVHDISRKLEEMRSAW